jgi:class 3 adenylate cyclase
MHCPECRTENDRHARSCTGCDASLERACPACGGENLLAAKFCSNCGARLPKVIAERPEPSGPTGIAPSTTAPAHLSADRAERRHLTVLFCDLVESTALALALDPEDFRAVVGQYLDASEEVVTRFGGYVAQRLGDGLMVYFGFPEADDDIARRAVRASLSILDAVSHLEPRISRRADLRLARRIGVATGLVVAGTSGEGAESERLAFGETPNLASRLKDAAAPGSVVISESTRRLVKGFFEMRNLGARHLKGFGSVPAVYEVLREGTARTRLEVMGSIGMTPLAGRDPEVRLLRERWDAVKRDGIGRVVLIGGEPGIGKSRLVRVLEDYVASESNSWLTACMASPQYRNTAFYPVIDLLERVVLQFGPDEAADERLRKLEGWLVQYGTPIQETLPLFARLLSLPVTPDLAAAAEHDPKQEKQKTMQALLDVLFATASDQPLLFVSEDLHWADPSTLELLNRLVHSAAMRRVLVVLTFRPEFDPPWSGQKYITRLTLGRLGQGPSTSIARNAAIGGIDLPQSLVSQILDRTDGVPLFIEELSRMVVEGGLLKEDEGGVVMPASLPTLAIPTTLRDSLAARLDRLAGTKAIAQLCAVLGREFPHALLLAVSGIPENVLDSRLKQLVRAEVLYSTGEPPNVRYVFKHALIQEAAYEAMLRSSRQELHRRVAEVLTSRFADIAERQPELIAHHYTEGDQEQHAVGFWLTAGQRALERSANLEAIAHLERARQLLSRSVPASPERDQQELGIHHLLAFAFDRLGEPLPAAVATNAHQSQPT